MPKKVCPNGHVYDSSIYGDECPLCPQGASHSHTTESHPNFGMPPFDVAADQAAGGTHISAPSMEPPVDASNMQFVSSSDPIGETRIRQQPANASPKTVIRPRPGAQAASGRRLVGFLVTYNRNPLGKAYNLYEGKNFIGRDQSCDVSVPEDNQMSGRHMSILYRNVDGKFKYRDEQSSNGTFVNKELSDEGELQNYDIIRLGGTVFIFIAIPKLG